MKDARKSARPAAAAAEDGAAAVLAKIAELPESFRALGRQLHATILASAPALQPRLWYGMPAYAKDGKVVCFFRGGTVQKPERYVTLGFSEEARLDDGSLWPIAFALTHLGADDEARLGALVKRAAG